MKEPVGGFSLFNIVIVFVLLFAGYVSLSINYSKAYNVKNEIINIIKNQGGICTSESSSKNNNCYNFKEQITDYFQEASYRSSGDCPKSENEDYPWIGYSRTGELIEDGKNAAFCVHPISVSANSELPNAVYYQVKVFYQLDLPIINKLFDFTITGETSRIYEPNECKYDASSIYTWCQR